MKKVTRGFLRIIMVFSAIVAFIYASATNPTITINYNVSGLTPGTPITVPLVIDAPSNLIGGFDLDINYNTDVLTYTTTNGQFIDLLLNGNFGSNFVNQPTYKIRVTWSETNAPVTLLTQVICNLHFIYNGGSTPLTLVLSGTLTSPGNSYIIDQDLVTYLPATWNNGSASGSGVDIHSALGGGSWTDATKWDLVKVPNASNNVFITLSNPITVSTNVNCNAVTINSGGQLTLNSTWSLNDAGNFSILDNGTNGSGSYVDFGTTTIGGTCSVQRYMAGNWTSGVPTGSTMWHYIASPTTTGTINTFLGDLLNRYDEPLQQWDALTMPVSVPLSLDSGYSAAPHTPGGVKTFTGGTLNTGNRTVSILTFTNGGTASYRGYNLIGNIYPSGLKWDNTWTKTNVDGSAWVWDGSAGVYWSNDGTTGTGNFANGVIPAEQGFFVHVTAAGTGSVTIPNAKRQHNTGPQIYYKDEIPDLINLRLAGNSGYDETVIFFTPNATTGYDTEYDTYKLFSGTPNTEIYSVIEDNTEASINVLGDFQTSSVIPVGIRTGATGTYTLTASKFESFPIGTSIFLEDKVTGQTVKLNDNPVYSFTSDAGKTQRFNLHFNMLGIPESSSSKINIYSNLKDVYVNIPTSINGNIFVYNLLGSDIANQPIQGNALNRISLNCPTGYYIVKVIGDNGITTGKVFIQ